MRRSKLEIYVDILEVLAQRGPLKLTQYYYNQTLIAIILKQYLGFLTKQELIEERKFGKAA